MPGSRVHLAVVGNPSDRRERLLQAIRATGVSAEAVDPDGDADRLPGAVVAVDEAGLRSLAVTVPDGPVLPVGCGPGFAAVSTDRAADAIDALVSGGIPTTPQPVLDARIATDDGTTIGRFLLDATVATVDPARISEFSVTTGGRQVARMRADGVVLATPVGSDGYARAAGGPVLGPGVEGVAVVPIAPFTTGQNRWVLDIDTPIQISVERAAPPVGLALDGLEPTALPDEATVSVSRVGTFDLARWPDTWR